MWWRRGAHVLVLGLVVGGSCVPTTPVQPDGGELRLAVTDAPKTLDPQKASFASDVGIAALVFEGLMSFDAKTLALIPAAAVRAPDVSADGRSYTFTLRDGLTYSDGTPLTADHFAAAYRRACDPATRSDYAFLLDVLEGCAARREMYPGIAVPQLGIDAPSERQIRFTLARAAAHFPALTALAVGWPARESDWTRSADWWRDPRSYVGNGPFRLLQHAGAGLVLERNGRYRAPPRLTRITIIVADVATALARYRANELDVASIPAASADAAADLRGEIVSAPTACTTFVAFDMRRPPFDERDVRLAFAKALDRDAYVRDVQRLGTATTGGLVPVGVPGHDTSDQIQSFDPAAARALLAGTPARTRAALAGLRFAYTESALRTARVRWLVAQWREHLDVTITPEPLDATAYTRRLNDGFYRDATQNPRLYVEQLCAEYPDHEQWVPGLMRSVVPPRTGYVNVALEQQLLRADAERDATRREQVYEDAARRLSSDAVGAWLVYGGVRYAVKPFVRGLTLSAFDALPGIYAVRDIAVAPR